jgi:hypothetical protein
MLRSFQIANIHRVRADLAVIRRRIEYHRDQEIQSDANSSAVSEFPQHSWQAVNIFPVLGSPERRSHISTFQLQKGRSNPAFRNFTRELYQFLTYQIYGAEDQRGSADAIDRLEDTGTVSAEHHDAHIRSNLA